jgi:hypothetical protein
MMHIVSYIENVKICLLFNLSIFTFSHQDIEEDKEGTTNERSIEERQGYGDFERGE